jgi:uncharacterized protein
MSRIDTRSPNPPSAPTILRPPFTEETARAKVKAAENAWNTRDPERQESDRRYR